MSHLPALGLCQVLAAARARGEARYQAARAARLAGQASPTPRPDPLQAEHQADNDNAVADREWTA